MDLKEGIIKTALKMVQSGLVRGTWGNISVRQDNRLLITPSGTPYEELTVEDIAVVDLKSGEQVGGRLKASSELPLHISIYRIFDRINGIVHTHSLYASAFAALGEEVPCYTEDQAQIIGGSIPVASYALPGSYELGYNVTAVLKTGKYAALMAKHGLVSVGRSLKEAFMVAEVAEKSANLAYLVRTLSPNLEPMNEGEIEIMRKNYLNSYSKHIL
ncbi:MAG TPA: class II aldolase/adducin family protein [Clostridia bacterium]|nr:class II aldolase/adducin family protein [Clostridia bacterium]